VNSATIDLALSVLDRQLIDSQGHRCGRVDDIELDGEPGKPLVVSQLLIGQAAAKRRLPRFLRPVVSPFSRRGGPVAVSWPDVYQVSHVVKLEKSWTELDLAAGERRAANWLARLPGAR
jgi:sporulation protein YlmC with PRC-barrel domain